MTVVLHWPSVGPYHLARARGVVTSGPAGTNVVVLATAGQVDDRPWSRQELPAQVKLETVFPDRNYPSLSRAEMRPRLCEALERWRPEVVGISGYGMGDSRELLQWSRAKAVPTILMSETKEDDAPRKWYREWVKGYCVRQFGSALCGGTPHRRYLEKLGMPAAKIFLKYDVVDNAHFAAKADEARHSLDGTGRDKGKVSALYFLASSRFIERKNLQRLVDAYAEYRTAYEGSKDAAWGLVLLGTGPLREQMMKDVERRGIEGIKFPGFQQLDELTGFYGGAGAFVHPALQEQWGLVVNEAMACGLPVLVSRTVGASHDLVHDGKNGFRFDPEDKGELVRLLTKVSSPDFPRQRFSDESRRIIAEWTPEDFGKNFWKAAKAAGLKA